MTAKVADSAIFWAGCLLVFYIPVSIAITNIAAALCIVAFLIRMFTGKEIFVEKRHAFLLFLFMLIIVVSSFNSLDVSASIRGIQRLLKYSFIFFALSHAFTDKKKMAYLAWAFLFGLLLVSVDGLVQFIGGEDFIRRSLVEIGRPLEGYGHHFKRINASFHNSQDFASYLAGAVPLALSMARYASVNAVKRIFFYLTLALSGICLVFTYSRGAALGVLSAALICSFLRKDRLILGGLIILLLLAPFIIADAPLEWTAARRSPLEFFYDSSRLMHWRTALNMIKAHPFFGIGINSFCSSYHVYRGPQDHYVGWYAHNSWLQLAAETGILGGLIIALLLGWVIKTSWPQLRRRQDSLLSAVSLGLWTGLISYCIAAFWDSSLQYSNPAVFFWTLLGLTVASSHCYLLPSGEEL